MRGSSPCEKPSTEAINSPKVRAFITPSRQSKRRSESRTGLYGRKRMLSQTAAMPIGILMAKSQCHDAIERIAAASVGPATEAMATTVALMPMPRPNWSRG